MARGSARPWIIVLTSTVLVLIGAGLTLRAIVKVWHTERSMQSFCVTDPQYAYVQWLKAMTPPGAQNPSFTSYTPSSYLVTHACLQAETKAYEESDYGELKDMGKAFLTLITAVFLASITFSEKIIDFKTAPRISTIAMFASWTLLLLAIFSCGIGLVMILSSVYDLNDLGAQPWDTEFRGVALFFAAGTSFALGLTAMLIAGLPVHLMKTKQELVNLPDS